MDNLNTLLSAYQSNLADQERQSDAKQEEAEEKKKQREGIEVPLGIELLNRGLASGRLGNIAHHLIKKAIPVEWAKKNGIAGLYDAYKKNGYEGAIRHAAGGIPIPREKLEELAGGKENLEALHRGLRAMGREGSITELHNALTGGLAAATEKAQGAASSALAAADEQSGGALSAGASTAAELARGGPGAAATKSQTLAEEAVARAKAAAEAKGGAAARIAQQKLEETRTRAKSRADEGRRRIAALKKTASDKAALTKQRAAQAAQDAQEAIDRKTASAKAEMEKARATAAQAAAQKAEEAKRSAQAIKETSKKGINEFSIKRQPAPVAAEEQAAAAAEEPVAAAAEEQPAPLLQVRPPSAVPVAIPTKRPKLRTFRKSSRSSTRGSIQTGAPAPVQQSQDPTAIERSNAKHARAVPADSVGDAPDSQVVPEPRAVERPAATLQPRVINDSLPDIETMNATDSGNTAVGGPKVSTIKPYTQPQEEANRAIRGYNRVNADFQSRKNIRGYNRVNESYRRIASTGAFKLKEPIATPSSLRPEGARASAEDFVSVEQDDSVPDFLKPVANLPSAVVRKDSFFGSQSTPTDSQILGSLNQKLKPKVRRNVASSRGRLSVNSRATMNEMQSSAKASSTNLSEQVKAAYQARDFSQLPEHMQPLGYRAPRTGAVSAAPGPSAPSALQISKNALALQPSTGSQINPRRPAFAQEEEEVEDFE